MATLSDDEKRRVFQRMKVLNLTRETLAAQLKMHSNTVGNALRGGSINRNSAERLIAFAHGEAKDEQPMIAVSPYAAEVFHRLAREMKVSPDVWCTGFATWVERQDRRFQAFIQDSVADAIRSMALPAITQSGGPQAGAKARRDKPHASTPT